MIRCTFYLYIGRDFRESRLVVLQTLAGKDKLGLLSKVIVASYPGLLAPEFVACSTNVGEGLVKLSHVV